jgi:hypothetical protein
MFNQKNSKFVDLVWQEAKRTHFFTSNLVIYNVKISEKFSMYSSSSIKQGCHADDNGRTMAAGLSVT